MPENENYRIICLGTYCLPRVITTFCNLKPRKAEGEKTCPFDICFSWNFDGVLDILDNEFKTFFEDVEFGEFENPKIKDDLFTIFGSKVPDTVWKHEKACIYFNHEGYHRDREKFVDTYTKRIQNLYEYLKDCDRKLYIVIASFDPINQEQIKRLNDIINRYRPQDSYCNIIINQSVNPSLNINLPNTFVIDCTKEAWRKLFRSYWIKVLERHTVWKDANEFWEYLTGNLKNLIR